MYINTIEKNLKVYFGSIAVINKDRAKKEKCYLGTIEISVCVAILAFGASTVTNHMSCI
jgi:hypothetical protein